MILEAMLCLSVTMFWIEAFWQPESMDLVENIMSETVRN